MTAFNRPTRLTNSSDAFFRAWAQAIHDVFALGWIQTADTGQINLATVAAPGASNTAQGYEVWRMNDALHSTQPIFVKIEYGSGPGGATFPGCWVTVGSGSNGSGTITGSPAGSRRQFYTTAASTVDYPPVIGSADGSRIVVGLGWYDGVTTQRMAFSVERTRDALGEITNVGAMCWHMRADANPWSSWLYKPGTGDVSDEAALTSLAVFVPSLGDGAGGGAVGFFPVFFHDGIYLPASVNAIGSFDVNVVPNAAVNVMLYGALKTFYNGGGQDPARGTHAGTVHLLLRYE